MDGLLDTAPCGVLVLDDAGAVRDVNRTLADALGTTPDALRRGTVADVLAVASQLYYQSYFFPLLRLRGQVHEVYLSFRTAAGDELPVLINAVRRDEGEGPRSVLAVVPIERRSRFEDEILEARRAAETAGQSRARLLSMLSHDVRSPLSAMTFSADLLAQGAFGPVTDAQRVQLRRIETFGQYVLRLVADVLDFSRLEAGRVDVRPARVDLAAAVAAALDLVANDAERRGIALATGGPDAAVWADPDRFQQVLVNLLGNAVKFTDCGGHVSVRWEAVGGAVAVRVADDGPGIAPERLESIFAPFIQEAGPGASGGVGLGLAISRELAEAMGGTLEAESVLGEGATFTLTLPEPSDPDGADGTA